MAQWIQRMVSAILLMVFVASIIPLALAERGSEREEQRELRIVVENAASAEAEENSTERFQENIKNARAVLEQERKEAMRDVREERKELKEDFREAREEARAAGEKFSARGKNAVIDVKERMDNLREKYIDLKVEYKQKRQEYQDHRRDLKQKHKDAKECEKDSIECREKKQELQRGVKQHLLNTMELIDRSLKKLTNQVEASEKLTEEEKQATIQRIAGLEVKVTGTRERVEAMSANSTNADLRVAIRDLKNVWQEIRAEQRKIVASLISLKQEVIVEKHEESEAGMQTKIDELRAQGTDVIILINVHQRFAAEVTKLKEMVAIAREKWQEAKEGQESLEAWKSAEKDVQAQMKKTKAVMREFITEYKRLTGETELEAETEETAEVSTSEPTAEAGASSKASVQE